MNRSLLAGIGLSALLFTACADERARPSGGGSIQPGERIDGLYVANADDSITRIDLETGVMRQIQLGQEPTRIARVGDRVYVSLRNERTVVALEEDGSELKEVARIQTGAEPFGVAATGERIYVAASVGGTVDEYDASSFEHLRSWRIEGEPRWVTLHTTGRSLYVGSTYGGTLTRIDLESGTASRIGIPRIESFNFNDGTPITLAARVTGDLAVSPDGRVLYAPMLYVDNQTTIPDVDSENPNPCDPNGGADRAPPPGGPGFPGMGCGGGGYDNQKFNPVATKIPLEETGEVNVTAVPEAIQLVSGVAIVGDGGFTVGFETLSSYPSAIAVSGDNRMVFAVLEGSAALVAFPADLPNGSGFAEGGASRTPNGDVAFPPGGFSFRAMVPVRTGAAPRGIAVMNDQVFVHSFFDRKVEEIDLVQIQNVIDYASTGILEKAVDVLNPDGTLKPLVAKNPRIVTTNTIDADVDAGRRLFFAANNPMMATVGAGVSCGTCHFDGRTDGITWKFERGLRQTPNLAVKLQDTLPVGWAGNVPTVADEGFNTSQQLMGGQGLSLAHIANVEKFLFNMREIDSPNRNTGDAAVVRGAAVFANVGCVTCHSGASYTDGRNYEMLGLRVVNTPALKGISASAPYFHDGSAASLDDVVERASRGEMGNAFSISAAEKADLVAYLKSL